MCTIVTVIPTFTQTEAPPTEWTRQFGTSAAEFTHGVAVDGTGIYVVGETYGAFPGQTVTGGAFIRKYDLGGTELWTRQFSSSQAAVAYGVAVDATGVYVVGNAGDALPGQTSNGASDGFIRKYDLGGTELWTRQFGSSADDFAFGVALDATGVYVIGNAGDALSEQNSNGLSDVFIRKYDLGGTELWTRQFGTNGYDDAVGIVVDTSGVYIVGDVGNALPGQTYNGGSYDAFISKYDPDGTELWTRQFGSSGFDEGLTVAVDTTGLYVAGETDGALPGQTSVGNLNAFIRKYDLGGTELWTHQFESSQSDEAIGVAVDATGVYVVGDASAALAGQTFFGQRDAFIRKYDLDGTEQWTWQFGTSADDIAQGIAVNATGVFVAGTTSGALPGQTNTGLNDAFILKIAAVTETPVQAIGDLIVQVENMNLAHGIENALDTKLQNAIAALNSTNSGNRSNGINNLYAFINEVQAQSGNKITVSEASQLIAAANQIITSLQ
jgi:hypothetical protein